MNIIYWVILLTFVFEIITIFARFICKMSSKHTYITLMKKYHLKHIIHMHHGIVGIAVLIITFYVPHTSLLIIGLALLFSDAFHHIVVLNYVVGNPEFHLVYRNIKDLEKDKRLEKQKMNAFLKHLIHHA